MATSSNGNTLHQPTYTPTESVAQRVQEYMQRSPGQSSTDPVPNHNHDGDGDGGGDASYLDLNAMAFPRELSLASNASHDEYLDSVAPPPQSLDAGGIHTLAPQPHAQTTPSVSVPMHGRPGRRPALVSSQTEGTYPTPPQHHHHHHHQNQHHDAPLPINYAGVEAQMYRSLLSDEKNSINSRNQAYASMAVVAALIAGISITFLVDVKFEFDATTNDQKVVLQFAVLGSMVVCFLALYATMVLSTQYYLVTRALGSVTTMTIQEEERSLRNITQFMKRTRTIRHLAVKAVVLSVPLFAVIIAAYGTAKTGLDSVGYSCIVIGVIGLGFFVHAIVSYHVAFSTPASEHEHKGHNIGITTTDMDMDMDLENGMLAQQEEAYMLGAEATINSTANPAASASPQRHYDQRMNNSHMQLVAKRLLQKSGNQVSNFKLVW